MLSARRKKTGKTVAWFKPRRGGQKAVIEKNYPGRRWSRDSRDGREKYERV